jgi:hypothetical protein
LPFCLNNQSFCNLQRQQRFPDQISFTYWVVGLSEGVIGHCVKQVS